MRRTACAIAGIGAFAAIAAGAVLAGWATRIEAALFVLLALLCYPFDCFLNWLAGWAPRRRTDQDHP